MGIGPWGYRREILLYGRAVFIVLKVVLHLSLCYDCVNEVTAMVRRERKKKRIYYMLRLAVLSDKHHLDVYHMSYRTSR
jgi:hypothetical protein